MHCHFKILLTTVGSEPLLAEAATQAMATIKTSPVKLLSNYLGTNCISVGERGELVAALLVMRARDVTYWQCRLVGGSSVAGAAIRARCPPSPPGSAVLCLTPALGVSLGGGSGRLVRLERLVMKRVNERDGLTPAFISQMALPPMLLNSLGEDRQPLQFLSSDLMTYCSQCNT